MRIEVSATRNPAHSSQSTFAVQVKNQIGASPRQRSALMFLLTGFLLLAIAFRNPFFGQWDSFDYVTKTVRGELSDLAFGRPLFQALNIAVWQIAHPLGVRPENAVMLLQGVILLFAVAGLVAFYFCVKSVGGTNLALLGVAWLATTPMYLAYSGMVMTEIPSLACLMGAVAFLLRWDRRGRAADLILSALLFVAGIHIREQLITTWGVFPFLILLNRRHSWGKRFSIVVAHAILVAGGFILIVGLLRWMDPQYWGRVKGWASVFTLRESGLLRQLFYLGEFALANSLVALIVTVAACQAWARHLKVRAIASGLVVLPLLALLTNSDLGIQPRYEIIAVPGFILVALVGLRKVLEKVSTWKKKVIMNSVAGAQIVFLSGGLILLGHYNRVAGERKTRVESLLKAAPRDAVFVCGAYTPILEFYRQSGVRPNWEIIRSGWEWNRATLAMQIAAALQQNRPVFLLKDTQVWKYLREEWQDVEALRPAFTFVTVDDGMDQIEWRRSNYRGE